MKISRKQIFEEFYNKGYRTIKPQTKAITQALNFIQEKIGKNLNPEGLKILDGQVKYLYHNVFLKEMGNFNNTFSKIEKKFEKDWNDPCITVLEEWLIQPEEDQEHASTSKRGPGRPSKEFIDVGKSTEYASAKKTALSVNNNIKILLLALKVFQKNFSMEEMKHLNTIISVIYSNLVNVRKINVVSDENIEKPIMMSQEESLAFLIENNLSRQVYQNLRNKCNEKRAPIFPSYHHIQDAKKECRPNVMNYEDTKASTTYKALFEHTAIRLVENESQNIKSKLFNIIEPMHITDSDDSQTMEEETNKVIYEATLVFADGGDGTTGFSHFNQKTESGEVINDHSLFTWLINPITLKTKNGIELWKNTTPNSPFSNRPIMFEFAKETKNYVVDMHNKFLKEKEELTPFIIPLDNVEIKITPEFHTTLIDGKIFNIITGTSSQSCPVCEAKPKDFLNREKCVPKNKGLLYGLQPLHAIINVFNFLLHVAYKMDNKTWQARTAEQKKSITDRKIEIQQRLRDEFGITFDAPRSGGFGNTTTGNLCRRVFAEPDRLAKALCLNVEMITNFSILLAVLNCKEKIDTEKLDELCKNTLKFFEEEGSCSWVKISPTVHKILFHSKEIIMILPLSPGYFSEEGSEAKNKYIKKFRLLNARKTSVKTSLADTFNRNMDASDPIIFSSSLASRQKKRKQRHLPERVLQYLQNKDLEEEIDTELYEEPSYTDNFDIDLDDYIFDIQFDNDNLM